MPTCDVCGKQVDLPYNCNECGGTYCSEHRLPENHDCPGLKNWGDPDGVFDSGFDDSVDRTGGREESGGLLDGLSTPDGIAGYFRGNVTFVFLGLMWITFLLQNVAKFLLAPTGSLGMFLTEESYGVYRSIFMVTAEHPEYVWTWFTSIFAHGGFFHIAFNSIVVYFFGQVVERYIGSRKFAALFLVSGALAGLGQVALMTFTADPAPGQLLPGVLGASGAALAIMGVLTVLNPNLTVLLYFLFPVPIWVLTIGFAVISALGVLQSNPTAGGIAQGAHLVGLAIGLVYGAYVKDKVSPPRRLQFGGGGGRGGPGGPRRRGPF